MCLYAGWFKEGGMLTVILSKASSLNARSGLNANVRISFPKNAIVL